VQEVRQAPVAALQRYGAQACKPASVQVPEPLQASCRFELLRSTLQAAAEQVVPAGYSAQLRAPEQVPVRPQLAWVSVVHSLSGSVPAATGSQNPARPAWLHLSHVPPQRDSQQAPSVQKPLAHSASTPQVIPIAFRHVPPTQAYPPAQSGSPAQEVRQAPVPASHA
jgi:hypothetical protein